MDANIPELSPVVVSPEETISLKFISLFNINTIIDERPTTIPAKSGARKTIFDFMSETISANKSLSLRFIF